MQEPFMSPAANANILPHQINENCLTDNKKGLGGIFFAEKTGT